jgi:hypothetical protein
MDDETLILLALVAVALLVMADRKPVPSVSTSSSVTLPDGTVIHDAPLVALDVTQWKTQLNRIIWQ